MSRGRTWRKTAATARRWSKVGSRLRLGRPRFFRQGFPSAALAAAVSAGAALAASQRRRLAVGQVEDSHLPALLDQADDRAAHAQLGIIRMRCHDQRIERAPAARMDPGGCEGVRSITGAVASARSTLQPSHERSLGSALGRPCKGTGLTWLPESRQRIHCARTQ